MVVANRIFSSVSQLKNIFIEISLVGVSKTFSAVQFVLSDEFSNLSADGRYNLMHEGINSRSLNAYVEIIFDNSDNRIMVRWTSKEILFRCWILEQI